MVVKTAYTFKRWYWQDIDEQPPNWWHNFLAGRFLDDALRELRSVAKVWEKSNGKIRVVFNTPEDLMFFILRWS